MARLFQAVIGANFGDEGKGRTVDFLCQNVNEPLVVRHNSGAQAGHTVQLGGLRHVHQHFGSGTLRGVTTLLTHRFVVNPLAFNREWEELERKGIYPNIYIDENCIVSSPLDMLLNQLTEIKRGSARHGSCGLGFGETLARHEDIRGPKLRVKNMLVSDERGMELGLWFVAQVIMRDLDEVIESNPAAKNLHDAIVGNKFNWAKWREECRKMLSRAIITRRPDVIIRGKDVIFEGAQGLLLHQDHQFFPHVTRSRTGLEDVVECIQRWGEKAKLEAYYCSRTYITRHGAGPLPGELPEKPYEGIVDLTNEPNEWQGSLRFADYDRASTMLEITKDIMRSDVQRLHSFNWSYVLNCADQVPRSAVDWNADLIGWSPYSAETEDNRPRVNRTTRRNTMGAPSTSPNELDKFATPPIPAETETETGNGGAEHVEPEGDSGLGAGEEAETTHG